MISSIFARRLKAVQSLHLYTAPFFSTIPVSYFCSKLQNPPLNRQNFDSNTVSDALSSYGNDWKRAMDFFNWVETECGFRHTTATCNRMIDILGKFFEFGLSWELINRMRKDPLAVPNHMTFRVLFKRYTSAHLVEEAINTYRRLDEFSLKDETSYCNLIDALCEHRHVIEAQEFCFGEDKDDIINAKIKTKIHNMILRGWFKMGWWGKCREFWEEMDLKGVQKDTHSYTIYMDILCKSGKPEKAVKFYKAMRSKGIKLDVVAYNTVIRCIGLSKGVDFAKTFYKEMQDMGCEPNVVTCNTVIKLLCENGRMKEAYELLDEMPKKGIVPNVITYHCFFGCLMKPKEILLLFDRMIDSGVRPSTDTFVMLLKKFGRWGFLRPVFIVWERMEELGISPDEAAYNAFIDALIEKGMVDMARKKNEEMLAKELSAKPREELGTKLVE